MKIEIGKKLKSESVSKGLFEAALEELFENVVYKEAKYKKLKAAALDYYRRAPLHELKLEAKSVVGKMFMDSILEDVIDVGEDENIIEGWTERDLDKLYKLGYLD